MGDLLDPAALHAARQWAHDHGHPQPDDRMLAAYGAVIAGQVRQATATQTVADLERHADTTWARHGGWITLHDAAAIARRAGDGA